MVKSANPIRLVAGFFTVGGWTMLSRIGGLIREMLLAATLGASPVASAFIIAFALPNMFRRFFAEGAFNMAFVPMFSKKLESDEDAAGFAQDAFAGLATVLIIFTLLAQLAMPWLVLAMASGFAGDERFDLTVTFGRIIFPYILLISLAALLSGVLNAMGRFSTAAAAPVVLNIILIAVLAGASFLDMDVGLALSWGVVLAGFAQLAMVWYAVSKLGLHLGFSRPRMTPELKRLAIIAAPAALAGGVVQVNLLVGRQVASFFDGAVAWLYYADRLYQLPLGVVGVAIGVVLLPDLSRKLQTEDTDGGRNALNRAAEFTLALTLPAAVALVIIPYPLISVLFERGAFGAEDSAATAAALAIYGFGLPAFVLQKVLQPLFFAREDTKTPFYYALISMVVNAALAFGLAPVIGYLAAAVGTTLSAWVMVVQLWLGSRKMGAAAQMDTRLLKAIPKIILASLIMGLCTYGLATALAGALQTPTLRYGALLVLVGAGAGSYGLAAMALGAFSKSDFGSAFRRGG